MWYILAKSHEGDPDFSSFTTELLQGSFRNFVVVVGGIYTVLLFATAAWPDQLAVNVGLILPLMVLVCILVPKLLSTHFLVSQAVWQAGLAMVITLIVHLFQEPAFAFLYVLLPLMATVTIGWSGGLLAEGLVGVLVWWLSHGLVAQPPPTAYTLMVVISGAIVGLFGLAMTHTLLTVTQWSFYSFEQARQRMEEARDQQLELKQVQEDLVQANRELARLSDRLKAMHRVAEEARQAKAEFVANVSHELRTPLNMIVGFSEVIAQSPQVYGGRLSSVLLADIAAIQRNAHHLAKLVNDVLDLSQIEAGRMGLSKGWVSMQEVLDEAVLAVSALFESKGLYLETDVPLDLPQVYCDSTRIRQVVLNLLSNAGRFTEHGGVRVRVRHEKDKVVVGVTDTGPGIAPEDQERLFEPFQQLSSFMFNTRSQGGSGLGLSISRQFVEMHGGTLWVESEVGGGTTFYLSLKLEMPLPAVLSSGGDATRWLIPGYEYKARTRPYKAPAPTVVPRFVLLEQGETLWRLASRYMDDVEITPVENAEGAIRELGRSPAQALIVNPPLLGTMDSSIEQLGNLPYDTPMFTCLVSGGEDEAAKRLGVVCYLVKPITRQTLLSTLESLGDGVKSVLLVDDEPEVLQLFARILSSEQHGYHVLQAMEGQRALGLMRRHQPDLVLLDLIMPGMDGFQVLQEKGQDPAIRDIPVIVISARDPMGEPIVSSMLTVTRSGGLSVRHLLSCIQAVSDILMPSVEPGGQERPERTPE